MSKSLGNVSVLHELIAKYPPEALRFALLTAQYRQPLDWSDTLIEQSIKTLDRLYGTLRDLSGIAAVGTGIPESIDDALCDDLNTPAALAEIARIAGEARRATDEGDKARLKADLLGAGLALGLLQQDPAAWFARGNDGGDDARIQALVDERIAARKAKDFARSDAIRDELAAEGIVLEDTAQGVRWVRRA
jgi:cysteinyl-tRNA synthetase